MSGLDIERIKKYFDAESFARDEKFLRDPILGYEQKARQQAISSLLNDDYAMALDAGCGNGRDSQILSKHADKLIGVDFSLGMLQGAKPAIEKSGAPRVYLVAADITNLPFKDVSFDLIVCSETLEHIPRWTEAVSELCRVLKPKGDLIISTPNKYSMYGLTRYPGRLLLGSKHPYDKWKSYFQLRNTLISTGFTITGIRGSCYLPGDISYYQPFKGVITHLLGIARFLQKTLSDRWPFSLLGHHIVLRGKKITEV